MRFQEADYPVIALTPQIVNGGNAIPSVIDTRRFERVAIHLSCGDMGAALTALKVQESATGLGDWSDVAGAALTGSDLPAATSECKTFTIYVQMTPARKRFLQLIATAASGDCYISAVAILSGGEVSPKEGTVSGFSGFSGWTH